MMRIKEIINWRVLIWVDLAPNSPNKHTRKWMALTKGNVYYLDLESERVKWQYWKQPDKPEVKKPSVVKWLLAQT